MRKAEIDMHKWKEKKERKKTVIDILIDRGIDR